MSLNTYQLKYIALLSMVIDHAAVIFRTQLPDAAYLTMRCMGRISFPVFCFTLVEGFFHSSNQNRYLTRLALFAVLSEIPFDLALKGTFWNIIHHHSIQTVMDWSAQNVFFTLLFGFLGLCLLERLALAPESRRSSAALLLLLLLVTLVFRADYGSSGFGFILLLYLLRTRPLSRAVVGSCFLSSGWKAGLAFVPIAFYNGKRGFLKGRAASLCFYAIYPLQMLIFYIIRKNTVGF